MGRFKRFALGTLFAAIAGYVAGILTAPQSGKETREDIKETLDSGRAKAEKQLKKLHTDLDSLISEAKVKSEDMRGRGGRELRSLVEKATDAKQKARELISAIHEGEADDRDLKRAMKDADKAIKHLRRFLSK